ncbi:MAG: hypothetical protein HY238_03210 [Acidobacteria bacterium]|nr:hypothetical protein [Acidobacteriota bacterium]
MTVKPSCCFGFLMAVTFCLGSVPVHARTTSSLTQVTPEGRRVAQYILAYYGNGAAASRLYVGSEACMACHKDKTDWRNSLHATGLKTVSNDAYSMQVKHGVVVDYDRNGIDDFKQGLDFNRIASAFDPYKPNAPVLRYDASRGYLIRIGNVDYSVKLAHGGSGLYKQRFLVKIPVTDRPGGYSAGTYYSPIQYNEAVKQYSVYEPSYWYNADNTPKISGPLSSRDAAKGKSFDKECSGCHTTALGVAQDPYGEYVAVPPPVVYAAPEDPHYFDLLGSSNRLAFNIGCERCHGPGSQHITELGDPSKIINPAKNFTAKQNNELCGSCHSRGKSKPNAVLDYPFDETTAQAFAGSLGEDLYGRFFVDRAGLWPDNTESRQHHQQFQDFKLSAKWEFQFHKVTCSECHDVHQATPHHLRTVMKVESGGANLEIPAKVEDNSLCLACHAGFGPFQSLKREDIVDIAANRPKIALVVEAHTHHPYEPERRMGLSRCTECHMAKMAASAVPYDIASHTFKVASPEQTLATRNAGGMPNSCSVRCHRPLAPLMGLPADANLTNWAEPSDAALAEFLKVFYGPDGLWWNTRRQ